MSDVVIDHWQWCVLGLHGVTGQIESLSESAMRPSPLVLEQLIQERDRLTRVVLSEEVHRTGGEHRA